MCKLGLKDAYFSVPLPLLWLGTSTMNLHKIVKSANDNLTHDKHQNYNLLRRHAIDYSLFRRDTHEPRHVIFLLQHLGFAINWKNTGVDTSAGNRFFGLDNQLCHSRTFFKQNEYT